MPKHEDCHADDERLEQYAMESLPQEEAAGLEQHLLICRDCQDRLAKTDAYVQAMQAAARKVRREGSQK